ncbi:hypothetical protein FOA52_008159 [Chlamydomonas sp. UWO 241]|nr:hypothetical protein FOA52_008159 [Chlamydomonas sp. UWO 241]
MGGSRRRAGKAAPATPQPRPGGFTVPLQLRAPELPASLDVGGQVLLVAEPTVDALRRHLRALQTGAADGLQPAVDDYDLSGLPPGALRDAELVLVGGGGRGGGGGGPAVQRPHSVGGPGDGIAAAAGAAQAECAAGGAGGRSGPGATVPLRMVPSLAVVCSERAAGGAHGRAELAPQNVARGEGTGGSEPVSGNDRENGAPSLSLAPVRRMGIGKVHPLCGPDADKRSRSPSPPSEAGSELLLSGDLIYAASVADAQSMLLASPPGGPGASGATPRARAAQHRGGAHHAAAQPSPPRGR